jgi:4-hydroxybenzoate polyprenyltransferase
MSRRSDGLRLRAGRPRHAPLQPSTAGAFIPKDEMDEARTIRFYVAPVLLLMSLLWGAWFDPIKHKEILEFLRLEQLDKLPNLIGLVAGGGFVVFAFG